MDDSNNPYRVIILAAGIGSRLRPLTLKKPKALLNVGKRSIIDYEISSFVKCGVRNLHIVVGYKAMMIIRHLHRYFRYPQVEVSYIYNPKYKETNTAYSLWLASTNFLEGTTFVVNGDTLLSPEAISRMLSSHASCLGYSKHLCGHEEVKLRLLDDRVVEIGKNLDPKEADGEYVGLAMFDRKTGKYFRHALDEAVKNGKINLYYDDIIQKLTAKFYIKAVDLTDLPVMEIDTLEELEEANAIYERN